MPTPTEIERKFWKALKSDMTVMIGLDGAEGGHSRPMTAQVEGDHGPLWFFSAKGTSLVDALPAGDRATASFASKGHDLFASIRGTLAIDNDRAVIDRLWNPFVAAWYEGGKDDPKLVLLRFDTEDAEIWLDETSLLAGVKLLLGIDPKKDYKDKVAQLDLR